MNKFLEWYLNNGTKITWFIIGMCCFAGLDALSRGNYSSAVINFGVAYINYALNRR